MKHDELLKTLNWRYATKIFDKTKKVPDEILNTLLESLRLSPSSLGVQPWKFLMIENIDLRNKIQAVGHNQPQFADAPHLIVLCRREDVNGQYVERHVAEMAKIRNIEVASLEGYKKMVLSFLASLTPAAYEVWTSKQLYIALGFLLTSAAALGVDACPMEGFDALKVDGILGLGEKNMRSTVMCALGYRSSEDKYALLAKSRFPQDSVVEVYR